MEITVAYGPSGKQVKYHFIHGARERTMTMMVSGDPQLYHMRILLPTGKVYASLKLDKKEVVARVEKMEDSLYVIMPSVGAGQHTAVVTYR